VTASVKPRHRDQRDHHYEDVAGERVLGALRFMADHGGHEVADPPTDG
jgi:hypothetical protein